MILFFVLNCSSLSPKEKEVNFYARKTYEKIKAEGNKIAPGAKAKKLAPTILLNERYLKIEAKKFKETELKTFFKNIVLDPFDNDLEI